MTAGDFPVFPDAEAVVSGWLRSHVTDLNLRVYSSIPKKPTYPLATVWRIGGTPVIRQYLDCARIDVSIWGGAGGDVIPVSKSEIADIAAECRATLMDLEGEIVHDPVDAFVSGVDDALGLTWLPDPVTGRDRYIFSVLVYLRAEPATSS